MVVGTVIANKDLMFSKKKKKHPVHFLILVCSFGSWLLRADVEEGVPSRPFTSWEPGTPPPTHTHI